jgi:hypothetical protein
VGLFHDEFFKRLDDSRNHKITHLTDKQSPTRITHDEQDFLAVQMVKMTLAMSNFAPSKTVLYDEEIRV